jgi:hypothetical protein
MVEFKEEAGGFGEPGSYFVNHPNYEDVQKTTFEKGTISDFEVLEEDPFTVSSRVKVKGSWGESEYLPLFFRPKEKYWDSDDHEATDFNEEGQYYEKAWMSFRCDDDEVIVMVQGSIPLVALGFYDGVPRIGEDIVKAIGDTTLYAQMSKMSDYSGGEEGPDGLDLGLKLEIEPFKEAGDWKVGKNPSKHLVYKGFVQSLEIYNETIEQGSDWMHDWYREVLDYHIKSVTTETKQCIYSKLRERSSYYLVPVGPILYFIFIYKTDFAFDHEADETQVYEDSVHIFSCIRNGMEKSNYPDPNSPPVYYESCSSPIASNQAAIDQNNAGWPKTYDRASTDFGSTSVSSHLYAALYTKELYDKTTDNPPEVEDLLNDIPPDGFTTQTNFYDFSTALTNPETKLQMNIRPHTKEELQDAGLWPEGSE